MITGLYHPLAENLKIIKLLKPRYLQMDQPRPKTNTILKFLRESARVTNLFNINWFLWRAGTISVVIAIWRGTRTNPRILPTLQGPRAGPWKFMVNRFCRASPGSDIVLNHISLATRPALVNTQIRFVGDITRAL